MTKQQAVSEPARLPEWIRDFEGSKLVQSSSKREWKQTFRFYSCGQVGKLKI